MANHLMLVTALKVKSALKTFTPIKGYFPLGSGLLLAFLFWFAV